MSVTQQNATLPPNQKLKPDWAGEDLLSRFVNLLIQTKPIYRLMKQQARQMLIRTAEKKGIPWRKRTQELEKSTIKTLLPSITNPNIVYPDYYRLPFHAYEQGDLCWQAAFEAESATYSMALRVWKNEELTWQAAYHRLCDSFHQVLAEYSPDQVTDILDLGCSIGISTLAIHRYYSQKQNTYIRTIGLDLSPYMLAVAKVKDEQQEIAQWLHAKGEETELPDNSFDIVTLQFILHELPRQVTKAIFREVYRILKPNGVIAILDINPGSPVLQNLPPALFILMKSTEPWIDDYCTFDVEKAIAEAGFEYKTTVPSDPRHRTIIGIKTSSA